MITLTFFEPGASGAAGAARTVQCESGQSLMQAALEAGVNGIEADCGGILNCATCHVYEREPHLDLLAPPSGGERDMLEFTASARRENSRLSCQISLTETLDGMVIDIPELQF